jgi:hypothetical protein
MAAKRRNPKKREDEGQLQRVSIVPLSDEAERERRWNRVLTIILAAGARYQKKQKPERKGGR